jgi:hypothetical protein
LDFFGIELKGEGQYTRFESHTTSFSAVFMIVEATAIPSLTLSIMFPLVLRAKQDSWVYKAA